MNLHEYQARALLKAAGVPMLEGDVASTPDEANTRSSLINGVGMLAVPLATRP